MTSITRAILATLNTAELSGLFARITREVSDASPGSREWHDAIVSLDCIRQEQARRHVAARPRPRGPSF